jgi:hypothetical protein
MSRQYRALDGCLDEVRGCGFAGAAAAVVVLGGGDGRVADVSLDVLNAGVLLEGDRHIGVPERVGMNTVGHIGQRGAGLYCDAPEQGVDVEPGTAGSFAGRDQG